MKRIFLILAAFLLLAACQPTPDQPIVVQKDTERLVDTVLHQSPEGTAPTDAMTDAPGFVKSDEHYAYDYQSGNGRLTIHADADVYLPASGRISMARVCESGFSDEWVKTAFYRIFQGETAYSTFGGHAPSKADIARDIANTSVDTAKIVERIGQMIFGDIYTQKKYRYGKYRKEAEHESL